MSSNRRRPSSGQRKPYRRHEQRAAVRRRRMVLLLVMVAALGIVGVALAYPRLQPSASTQPTAATGGQQTGKADGGGDATGAATADAGGDAGATGDAAAGGETTAQAPEAWPDWKPTPQAQAQIDAALANGRPPQFLISSFDGAADIAKYREWLPLAQRLGARFTFFVSGIYMLMPEYAKWYQPPHKPAGFSNLGGYAELAGSKSAEENIYDNLKSFNAAREMGNEIGTHYVSHICEESNAWTTADWVSENSQWEKLMLQTITISHLKTPFTQLYTKDDFHGGRTPCLAGEKSAVYAASKRMGWEYDASEEGILGAWPKRQQGIWSFPLPSIPRVGSKYDTLAMDYNFYFNHGKTDDPARVQQLEDWTYESYYGAFRKLYTTNRAPLVLGSHFADWNHGAYNRALERTLEKACTTPEVACVTFITLARWLDEQSPAQLAKWEQGDFGASSGAAGADTTTG